MAQRPRLGQLKRNDVNFKTFKEQFEELEDHTGHFRPPVRTRGELPFEGNVDGSQCLVIEEGVVYYWDIDIQNWQPIIGQVFKAEKATFKRWKKTYVATKGQTDFVTDIIYETGLHEIDVYLQGLLQDEGIDYVEIDNHTIQFLEPLPEGAIVTLATPMIVESTSEITTYLQRLADLEYNNYQLMLNQYYDGKNFEAMGMVFDGFINTSQIDYSETTSNVLYDATRKSIYMYEQSDSSFVEQFDSSSFFHANSTVYRSNSQITLPISLTYSKAFVDDFSTNTLFDPLLTNVFWDRAKGLVTNDETGYGGSTYYKGDFMGGTGNADMVGFSESLYEHYYYNSNGNGTYDYINQSAACYAVLAMGNITSVVNAYAMLYRGAWPYSSYTHHYRSGNQNNIATTRGITRGLWIDDQTMYCHFITYVRSWNQIVALRQSNEASGRYYQRLCYTTGRNQNLSWSWANRPSGMPNTTFGSPVNTFTQSSSYISQIGATYEHLLLRVGNVLYFLNSSYNVVKTLDWSQSSRKPSTYNVTSNQITADKKYIYFPARLLRDGVWGYYLEAFLIEDGSFVNEILVTRDYSGTPGTTAMSFDHDYNRLVLGQQGSYRYTLFGKAKNNISEQGAYAGFLAFEAPDERVKEVVSKPIYTNLPTVYYRLNSTHTLNSGTIDYYIRFNDEAWTLVNRGSAYTWTNPKGASETLIQMRAVLKSSLTSTKAPEITAWDLDVRSYLPIATYRSKQTLLPLDGVTGGSLKPTQVVPNETSIKWFVEIDKVKDRYPANQDGIFAIPKITGDGYFTAEANFATNNVFMSPVVNDYKLQLYRDSEGILVTETSKQLFDIIESNIWVTTSAGNGNYDVEVSRDGGDTWIKAVRRNSVQTTKGDVETNFYADFKEDALNKKLFKMRFILNGATEILQYGAKIN